MSGMFLSGMLLFDGFADRRDPRRPGGGHRVRDRAAGAAVRARRPRRLRTRPGLDRMRRPHGGSKVWGAILGRVLARPGVSVAGGPGLPAACSPRPSSASTPRSSAWTSCCRRTPASCRRTTGSRRRSPAVRAPADVVITAPDVHGSRHDRGRERLQVPCPGHRRSSTQPIQVTVHAPQSVIEISVPLAGDGTDATSVRALDALREDVVPATFGQLPGTQAYVTGNLAFSQDFNAQLERSIAARHRLRPGPGVPAHARRVPLGHHRRGLRAAQRGVDGRRLRRHGGRVPARLGQPSLVGGRGVGAIESWIPLFAFVILFGLSMDYHVFVVSRIREAHDRGLSTKRRGRPRHHRSRPASSPARQRSWSLSSPSSARCR